MSSLYLAQARHLLIQEMAIIIDDLTDELDKKVCALKPTDFAASTDLLHTLKYTLRRQWHCDRPVSPTDDLQYDGINSSSFVCLRSLS